MVIFTGLTPAHRPQAASEDPPQDSISPTDRPRLRVLSKLKAGPRKLLVVKFGGSSLATAKRISLAIDMVAREYSKGTRLVVVVSAVGRTTDRLLELTNGASGIVETDRDDILAMGERTSARIVSASLKSRGIQTRYFDPSDKDWPILTDNNFSNAKPLESPSSSRIRRYVRPFLDEGIIPVIGGFIGRTRDGRISTLGRGGSDTTALVLAKALKADEVVLVTNAAGIMTGDPKILREAHTLRRIDIKRLVGIADSGTKFIHRKALKFKDPGINLRVIPQSAGTLHSPGTSITGEPFPELEVKIHNPRPSASITLVGRGLSTSPDLMRKVTQIVRTSLLAESGDGDSTILYVKQTAKFSHQVEKLHRAIIRHPAGVAVAVRKGLAMITVRGVGLEDAPGVTARISETLRINNINIFGMLTITSSVLLFVAWNTRKTASRLIRTALGETWT